jgi:hypothetical protein
LLALALPAQGVIATTMVFCGPNHHEQASVAAATHGADAAHAHDDAAAPDKFAQSALQKCSVCASCCAAAAICDTVPKVAAVELVATHFAALAAHVEPVAADGPERPPRHFLA